MKKRLAFRIHKRKKAGKLRVKKKQERKFREFSFIFYLRHCQERTLCNRGGRFSFLVESRERTERGVQLCELVPILEEKGWGAVGLRGLLLFLGYVYVSIICSDLMNDKNVFSWLPFFLVPLVWSDWCYLLLDMMFFSFSVNRPEWFWVCLSMFE